MLLLSVGAFFAFYTLTSAANPVVIIPGFGGSRLDYKLTNFDRPHYLCAKNTDWRSAWINLENFMPIEIDCFAHALSRHFDASTNQSRDTDGVEVRARDFGGLSGVEYLTDTHIISEARYFYDIVERLNKQLGLERGKQIRAAPYDWRMAPHEQTEYFEKVKNLIEDTYESNGNTPVVLICHSMGNLFGWYLLNQQTQEWKDKYIKSFVALSGPFAGAVKTLMMQAFGVHESVLTFFHKDVRYLARTLSTVAFMLPDGKYWPSIEPLIATPNKNYTSANLHEYFADSGFQLGSFMWQTTKRLLFDKPLALGVELHCLNGRGVSTVSSLIYKKQSDFPDGTPTEIDGDGDGSVNVRSLRACVSFKATNGRPVYHQEYDKAEHNGIMSRPDVLDYIVQVVSGTPVAASPPKRFSFNSPNDELSFTKIADSLRQLRHN